MNERESLLSAVTPEDDRSVVPGGLRELASSTNDPAKRASSFPAVPFLGHYLGVPVIAVEDHGDWLTCLWPDHEKPKKKHPVTYRNGEWWKLLRSQITVTICLPPFTVVLEPKPVPNDA